MKKLFKKVKWYYYYIPLVIETWWLNLGPKQTYTIDELLESLNEDKD